MRPPLPTLDFFRGFYQLDMFGRAAVTRKQLTPGWTPAGHSEQAGRQFSRRRARNR